MQEIHIESRVQTLASDALLRRMSLEQRQRQLTQQGKVRGTVACLDATVVFPKRHIQLPVQAVLNPPMMPQGLPIKAGARHGTTDKVTQFIAGFAADGSL